MTDQQTYAADAFGVTDDFQRFMLSSTGVGCLATKEGMDGLCQDMLKAGIDLRGRVLSQDGATQTLLGPTYHCANPNDSPEKSTAVPEAFTRIEEVETVYDPIVLRPVTHLQLKHPISDRNAPDKTCMTTYNVYVVPSAPDVNELPKPGMEDMMRTLQVLKATGSLPRFWDPQIGNLVFLKGEDGKALRYPETGVPDDFKGKPIAYIRDLNGIGRLNRPELNQTEADIIQNGKDRIGAWLKPDGSTKTVQQVYDELPAAPEACVKACEQQYAITTKAEKAVREAGIVTNVPIPAAPSLSSVKTQAIAEVGVPEKQKGV